MDVAEHFHEPEVGPRRRRSPRYALQCRARIVIARRHYAGYIHNISQGGAKLRTITPIRKLGEVLLRLPDLPPIRGQLRWTDSYNAGVEFEPALSPAELQRWAATRAALLGPCCFDECRISEPDASGDHVDHEQFTGETVSAAA